MFAKNLDTNLDMLFKGRQLAAALKLQMTFEIMVYLVLDRRITVGNGVFGTENDVSVITLCFHSKCWVY